MPWGFHSECSLTLPDFGQQLLPQLPFWKAWRLVLGPLRIGAPWAPSPASLPSRVLVLGALQHHILYHTAFLESLASCYRASEGM